MPKKISAAQARATLPRILDDVEKGKSIVIYRYNRPMAIVSPCPERKRRSRCDDSALEKAGFASSIHMRPTR